jgi:chemotaxis response regulator CheB
VNSTSVRLLIADDAAVIRNAIKRLLVDQPSIELLGEAENFKQAISMATALKPDVVLLDLHMPDDSEIEPGIVRDHLSVCGSKVVAMSLSGQEDSASRILAEGFGAVAILDKAELYDVLISTLWKISRSDEPTSNEGK